MVVQHHPNRASTDLRGIWGNSLRHGSILARVGASGKPGTVQDFHDHLLWHPNLGHLEHDVAAVADDLRAELDQLLAQTRPKSPPYPGNGGLIYRANGRFRRIPLKKSDFK